MSYFSELREKRLHRRIKKVRDQGGEPIVKKLHKSILYEEDAYEVICKYVNLAFGSQLMTVGSGYDRKSNLLKLVSEPQECEEHYWLYVRDGLYFMVEIGLNSKIYIGREICLPVSSVGLGFAYIRVPLKNCKWQLGVPSRLYGYFMYSAAGLEPIALMLEGKNVNVEDFDESVWNARVEYTPEEHHLEGYNEIHGHKGSWYDVWFSIAKRGPIFDKEEAEHLPINAHERWWKGEKIIRQFEADKRPTLNDMMNVRDEKVQIVDFAKWAMPQIAVDPDSFQYVIELGNSKWGITCTGLIGTETLRRSQVQWRSSSGKRPWLAGIVKERMCALIHVTELVKLFKNGVNIDGN